MLSYDELKRLHVRSQIVLLEKHEFEEKENLYQIML